MSEPLALLVSTPLPVMLLAGAAAGCAALALPRLLPRPRRADPEAEAWRERPPWLFRLFAPIVRGIAPAVAARGDRYRLEAVGERIQAAGLGYALRPEELVALRRVTAAVAALLAGIVDLASGALAAKLAYLAVPLGYFYPDIWLRDAIQRRRARIRKDFPFFLDLLALAMRAGLNLQSAIARAVRHLPDGPVREEMRRVLRELRAGMTLRESLQRLARRADVEGVSGFVGAVLQAEETGGEMAKALQAQAEQQRAERFLRAEKLAARAPVKMLAPLVGLFMPVTFVILMLPAVRALARSGLLAGLLGGG